MKIEIWSRALAEVGDKNITVKIKSFKLYLELAFAFDFL